MRLGSDMFLWHVLELQSCLPFLLASLALALEQYLLSSNACQWHFFSCMAFFLGEPALFLHQDKLLCSFLQVHGFFAVAAVSLLSSTVFHAPHTPMELVSLHHHSLCLFFAITKVPKDFSHFAVVLVVNNPMQRDEHTKGQYTNAMHMHVHAFHTHTMHT